MDRRTLLIQSTAFTATLAIAAPAARREPILGGACQGCDWVYEGMPATLASRARIAPTGEAGAPMLLEGVVRTARGAPARGIIVYAYHTNQDGIYPPAGNRHGSLRGWAITDAEGRYRFDTIRPAAYPTRDVPEHVHMHVIEREVGTYYIDNVLFEDDALLAPGHRRAEGRGGPGLVRPQLREGVWQVRRDIVLGREIPGYPA